MKLVDRKTFLTLPAGTLYAKGTETTFGPTHLKADNRGTNDWWYLDPATIEPPDADGKEWIDALLPCLDDMRLNGASYPMGSTLDSDGLYEEDALFLIFELDDLITLRDHIVVAIDLELNKA